MRKLTIGIGLGAVLSLVMATSAYAVSTEATWTSSSTGSSSGGSKAAPAPFSGTWTIKATNNANPSYRAAVPFSWSWSWEGVTVRQKGIPTCSIQAINDAKSTSVCPRKSHVGISATPAIAEFGPLGSAEGPNTQCLGKTFDIYNSTGGQLALVLDGPPEQCATLGFLGAYPITLAKSGGKTTMTWTLAENIKYPLPGAEGGLPSGNFVFNKLVAKSKKGTKSLLTSVNCKGARTFTMTVVDAFGTHPITNSAGKCKPPKTQ